MDNRKIGVAVVDGVEYDVIGVARDEKLPDDFIIVLDPSSSFHQIKGGLRKQVDTKTESKPEPNSEWDAWLKKIEDAINRSERKRDEHITVMIDRRALADAIVKRLPDTLNLKGGPS